MIYYGFDLSEKHRIQRRSGILGASGYRTDYPLALWRVRTIQSTREIGIEPPSTYDQFKHANCIGCLKARKQHWYIVYCTRPDIFEKAKWAEDEIGYSIIHGATLEELEPTFDLMRSLGVPATEHIPQQRFWADVKKKIGNRLVEDADNKPCECVI